MRCLSQKSDYEASESSLFFNVLGPILPPRPRVNMKAQQPREDKNR